MADQVATLNAWLVWKTGTLAGQRRLIREDVTRVGRAPDNDVIVDAATVSLHHFEIRKQGEAYRIQDLNSTNGTFVNGERIVEAALEPASSIRFGSMGPELTFMLGDAPQPEALGAATLIAPAPELPAPKPGESPVDRAHEELLSRAIARARLARRRGFGDQTTLIMREMLNAALRRAGMKFKTAMGALTVALVVVSGYGISKIQALRTEKGRIDEQIENIESMLAKAGLSESESDELADRLDQYESQARELQTKLLYRVTPTRSQDPVEREITRLMAEFGAETYSVPPEFLDQVKRFVKQYQGPDRPRMEAALGRSRSEVAVMRRILEENHLPPDLVYMALVESAVSNANKSSAGAAGIWQFTPVTAKAYGLAVGRDVDERLDIRKSTQAACRLLRDLILDFGGGSSVMLALAAYNSGTAKVKSGIRKVSDPIKQRNFWYLYRVRAVPTETREYVPKVIAAIIIARNPAQFGF